MPAGYSRAQIALHWIAVVLVAGQFLLSEGIETAWRAVERGEPVPGGIGAPLHVLPGMLVLIVAVWRLALRRRLAAPPAPAGESELQILVAKLVHGGLYAAMILMPITGGLAWFGGQGWAGEGHQIVKLALIVLVVLHVAGALYNQLVRKNGVMLRMMQPRD